MTHEIIKDVVFSTFNVIGELAVSTLNPQFKVVADKLEHLLANQLHPFKLAIGFGSNDVAGKSPLELPLDKIIAFAEDLHLDLKTEGVVRVCGDLKIINPNYADILRDTVADKIDSAFYIAGFKDSKNGETYTFTSYYINPKSNVDAVQFAEDSDTMWLLKTAEWLGDPESKGGITTCGNHRGYGFTSDCGICSRLKVIRERVSTNKGWLPS